MWGAHISSNPPFFPLPFALSLHHPRAQLVSITFGDLQTATMKTSMTEADFSDKQLGASGAIIVAAFLPKCQ